MFLNESTRIIIYWSPLRVEYLNTPWIKIGYYTYLLISGHLTIWGETGLEADPRLVWGLWGRILKEPVEIHCLEHEVRITETRLLDDRFLAFQIKRLQLWRTPYWCAPNPCGSLEAMPLLQPPLLGNHKRSEQAVSRGSALIAAAAAGKSSAEWAGWMPDKNCCQSNLELPITQDSRGSVFPDAGKNEKFVFINWNLILTLTTTSLI